MKDKHAAAAHLNELLFQCAKAHCVYHVMDREYMSCLAFPQLAHDNHGTHLRIGDEYMIVTCETGYRYYINVTADSPLTACAEVLNFVQYKV